jgi:AP-2 complex subunit alpha
LKQSGILFENEILQVGVKLEARGNLARVGMYYGNKTSLPFIAFVPSVVMPAGTDQQLVVQAKSIESTLNGGAQVQQLINVECVHDFSTQPVLALSFMYTTTCCIL